MADLLMERQGHVAVLTLNRPERRNAITFAMLDALPTRLPRPSATRTSAPSCSPAPARASAAGSISRTPPPARGIGGALGGRAGAGALGNTRDLPTVVLHEMDTPVMCAINGAAAGYGLDLALGCDLRLMAAGGDAAARLRQARRSCPESGGTWYLPRLVGWAKACEIGFLGRRPRRRARARGSAW